MGGNSPVRSRKSIAKTLDKETSFEDGVCLVDLKFLSPSLNLLKVKSDFFITSIG